jgi:hypothetical protein
VNFNITFDASVNSAPTEFKTTVLNVANFYAQTFSDNVTVNLTVGFGEVGGNALPSNALGASLTYLASTSYKSLVGALKADMTSSADHSSVASLPSNDPTSFGHYWVSTAEAKALGIYSGTGVDGSIGFSSTAAFDYNAADGVAPGSYDFFGTVAHEFSEVMGRMLVAGGRIGYYLHSYSALDLFHFAASHVRTFSGTKAGYFSVDGGATNLENFNTNPSGDFGDWSSAKGVDAFNAFATPGVAAPVSSADLTALDVIGWNLGTGATGTGTSGGTVTSVQLAQGGVEAPGGPAHGDLDGAMRSALLGVGQGLNPHLATSLDYYYAA